MSAKCCIFKNHCMDSFGSMATLVRSEKPTFSLMTFVVIIIVAALSFFPALALGPIADYLSF